MGLAITTPSLSRHAALAARVAEAQARSAALRESPEPQQMFLPGLDPELRAMPNHVARSSLFAPVARGRKLVIRGAFIKQGWPRYCGDC